MHSRRVILILLAVVILAALILGCDDWDGIDRSGWPATSTASAATEMALATADARATLAVVEVRQ